MEYVGLGKSNLMVSRVGLGAQSLNEINTDENAAILIHKAYDAGVNFFDISHSVQDSEKRLGACLSGIRQHVILATKTTCSAKKEILQDIEESLFALQTDYIDLYQYESDDENYFDFTEIYNTFSLLKERGKIRHFGFATESVFLANQALNDKVFETIQLPFNLLTDETALEVVKLCQENDIGFIAMRPLYSGLVRNIPLAQGFFNQHDSVIPLWGVRNIEELNEILYFNAHPPVIDEKFNEEVQKVKLFFN